MLPNKANRVDIEYVLGKLTTVFWWNLASNKRVTINQGGTSSSKTYSIMQLLYLKAITEAGVTITVVGQDVPNLRVGAIKDSQTILSNSKMLQKEVLKYNKSVLEYTFKNGSKIEFKSYDDSQDAKSGKRDYAFFNEGNGIPKDIYDEIADRTTKQIFIDFNPSQRCWIHDTFTNDDDTTWLYSNFTHNQFVSPSIVKSLLAYKEKNPYRWRVFGLGLTGQAEGAIFPNWKLVDSYPMTIQRSKEAYFLDFGYSNSPTGVGRACVVPDQPNKIFVQELIYKKELTDKKLADEFKKVGIHKTDLVIADPAAPQSIATLNDLYGYNIYGSKKPKDSIDAGINLLQGYEICVVKGSDNLVTELENYLYKKVGGVLTNTPIDKFNHLLDPLRYYALEMLAAPEVAPYEALDPIIH